MKAVDQENTSHLLIEKNNNSETSVNLLSLFFTFLKIGATSFGGYMSLISSVREKLVDKQKLIKDEMVLEGISLSSILPGPVAVNVVTYLGYNIAGISGAIVCATAVIIPSFILIVILAYFYFNYYDTIAFEMISGGILPAVAAIILATGVSMGKKSIEDYKQIIIFVLSFIVLSFFGGYQVILLTILISGVSGILLYSESAQRNNKDKKKSIIQLASGLSKNMKTVTIIAFSLAGLYFGLHYYFQDMNTHILGQLFVTFSGMSLTLFGGGYVFIPLIQETIVGGHQWLTQKEFTDAIAMGQITPGPILISATFIGYKMYGIAGALVATIAIFFPSGLLMVWLSRSFALFKESSLVRSAFKGIKPAIIGMIISAALVIGSQMPYTVLTAFVFFGVLVAFLRFKVSVVYLIPASGLVGWMLY